MVHGPWLHKIEWFIGPWIGQEDMLIGPSLDLSARDDLPLGLSVEISLYTPVQPVPTGLVIPKAPARCPDGGGEWWSCYFFDAIVSLDDGSSGMLCLVVLCTFTSWFLDHAGDADSCQWGVWMRDRRWRE
jgi:hypothetical protein